MKNALKTLAIAAALAAGTSGAALAQSYGYACPAGYAFYNGVCQPVGAATGRCLPAGLRPGLWRQGLLSGPLDKAAATSGTSARRAFRRLAVPSRRRGPLLSP